MSENSTQVQTIPKKFKIKKIEKTAEDEKKYKITDNVDLYIGDSINILTKFKNMVDLIYMDPPYDTNRNFTLDSKSNKTGFSDKWDKNQYELWLNNLIESVKKTLKIVVH